jgi:hypothetical protein
MIRAPGRERWLRDEIDSRPVPLWAGFEVTIYLGGHLLATKLVPVTHRRVPNENSPPRPI